MAIKKKGLTLQFLGAAETVTGSKYLLCANGKQYLIDCGLFQGLKKLRLLNRAEPPFEPKALTAMLLTHAHLDHVGYLPVLVKKGFKGPVFCTEPTAALAAIILRDSARLQEEEARLANETGYSQHTPAEALYTLRDVEQTLHLLKPVKENTWIDTEEDLRFRLRLVGHLLGAAFIELDTAGQRFVFSGDIGRRNDPILFEPQRPTRADVLVMESTYGDRLHPEVALAQQLARIIQRTISQGGTVIIPSFALERAQLLMYLLWQLKTQNMLPNVPLYLDSPMGAAVVKVFADFPDWHKLPERDYAKMLRTVNVIIEHRESQYIVLNPRPKVVIASSGMATGGRVISYLEQYLEKENCCVVLAGYQSEGTRGRQLLDGAAEIKIRGRYYQVKARVESLTSISSHADQSELLDWVALLPKQPKHVFLTHGEPNAADALRVKLQHTLGWQPIIPALIEEFTLGE